MIAIGACLAVGLAYRPKAEIPQGFAGQLVEIDGNPIRVKQAGSGPDLLLIHGCPGSVEDWDPVFDELAKRYRVTAYDRPGHGFSGSNGAEFNLDSNAEVARKLIEKLGLQDVTVLGHSYGSSTGLTLAVRRAPNVKRYVLIGSPGYKPVEVDALTRLTSIPVFGKGLCVLLSPTLGPKLIRAGARRGFRPNQDLLTDADLARRVRIWGQPKVPYARARELVTVGDDLERNSRAYKDIREPVVLIQGRNDTITRAAWKLSRDIPRSTLIEFDNVGHYSQFAKPQEVIDIIDRAVKTKV